jgi:hypothetical protein
MYTDLTRALRRATQAHTQATDSLAGIVRQLERRDAKWLRIERDKAEGLCVQTKRAMSAASDALAEYTGITADSL